jgi:hypothetical protein
LDQENNNYKEGLTFKLLYTALGEMVYIRQNGYLAKWPLGEMVIRLNGYYAKWPLGEMVIR